MRRLFLLCLAALSWAPAFAQPYPAREVRLVVPFPPGGQQDAISRLLASRLSDALGRSVLVENRAGAGGAIGSEAVARSAPDGYTLLMGSTSTLAVGPALNPKSPYDPVKDFEPISLIAYAPHVIAVNPAVPVASLRAFVAYAKAQPRPLAYGSAGTGTPHHLAVEMFKSMAGVDLVHVPYKGTAPAVVDLLSGQVQLMSIELPSAQQHLRVGRLKALALASPTRSASMPELPTFAEAGLPGFEINSWSGLVAPAGTPRAVLDRLSLEIAKALQSADVKDGLEKMGTTPLGGSPNDFSTYLRRESAKWAKAVKDSGAKMD